MDAQADSVALGPKNGYAAKSGDDLAQVGSEFSDLQLQLDLITGLPTQLWSPALGVVGLDVSVSLTTGGGEQRAAMGGIEYPGSVIHDQLCTTGPIRSSLSAAGRVHSVAVSLGGWRGTVRYLFRTRAPGLHWTWFWEPTDDADDLRDFTIGLTIQPSTTSGWTVNAPGNRLRPDLALDAIPPSTPVSTIGGLQGSVGLIGLSHESTPATVLAWPRSLDEIGETTLERVPSGVRITHQTGLAAAACPDTQLVQDGIALDILRAGWDEVTRMVPGWFGDLGIRTPDDSPAWTQGATIYEAQIGASIFAGGTWTYSPYPEPEDLLADLPRIASLGFDTLQLMPRQPFPSYNVIDYDDISLSYGDERTIKQIVDWSHEHGMRVILDILLHGVIDRESLAEAAENVRSGPWAALARAGVDEIDARALTAAEQRDLSWSRHILDFEDAWHAGSPDRHPLCDERPQWFCTDSSGHIIGIYTKAFDMSNPEWQAYFSRAVMDLLQRLEIDGFRFDAPSYNTFPNWAARTRTRASVQPLGSLSLFTDLRQQLRAARPDVMLYTEPNGPLHRQSMDLNYNYDEAWLPDSLFRPDDDRYVGGVRNGHELAQWLHDRDRTLPAGSVTAHHIDSHDTFWWPLPGRKWRREQFGPAAARALMCAFALAGGPYMMFVGGELGMEEEVAQVNAIRKRRPELAFGAHQYGLASADHALFAVTHTLGEEWSIVLVNLSERHVTVAVDALPQVETIDVLADGDAAIPAGADDVLSFSPYQARMLVPRRSV